MKRNGTLFLVGGKDGRNGDTRLLNRFVKLCGASSHVLVISTASSNPRRHRKEYEDAFYRAGAAKVSVCHPEDRTAANDPRLLSTLEHADGVYFSGGGQVKLVTTLAGTDFITLLQSRHDLGLAVGGTSAGATALSRVMIAGSGDKRAGFSVDLATGLGLLPQVIVDQHFNERDRLGRLLWAVILNPSLLGFGIDETTAVQINPGGRVEVLGAGKFTIIDGSLCRKARPTPDVQSDPAVPLTDVCLHVLDEGSCYDLTTRRPKVASRSP